MKTILITAYAVNPYKGSEDAMGWNMLLQAARNHKVIAVTRKNNRGHIEDYISKNATVEGISNLSFLYFDWPRWALGWKKGPLLSMLYYYGWQFTLAIWLRRKQLPVALVHNLNFHNDWTPTFLWLLGKPLVWGHVGHHPRIPKAFLLPVYGKAAFFKDSITWMIKKICWKFDPFLRVARGRAKAIIYMNRASVNRLPGKGLRIVHPSVASADLGCNALSDKSCFNVISVGRFVPLKGFDLTIRGFAAFYHSLSPHAKTGVRLTLVGAGPCEDLLRNIVKAEGLEQVTDIIPWMPRHKVIALYHAASVFLFPSHEGAGMVVPEAMSCALPVVCLRNTGPGTLVAPETSLSVPYGAYRDTCVQIGKRLLRLYADTEFIEHERMLSRARYESLFRWEVRGDMLEKLYEKILSEKIVNYKKQ